MLIRAWCLTAGDAETRCRSGDRPGLREGEGEGRGGNLSPAERLCAVRFLYCSLWCVVCLGKEAMAAAGILLSCISNTGEDKLTCRTLPGCRDAQSALADAPA